MDIFDVIRYLDTVFQIIVLIVVIWKTYLYITRRSAGMPMVFFSFAMIAYLVSNLYWIAHMVLRPGERLPFDANEIGEGGMFLMMASSCLSMLKIRKIPVLPSARGKKSPLLPAEVKREEQRHSAVIRKQVFLGIVCTAVFSLANIALWIGWSGEWLKDILAGLCFGYFLCSVVVCMLRTEALSAAEWVSLSLVSLVLLVLQGTIFVVPRTAGKVLDAICYILLFAGVAWSFLRIYRIWKKEAEDPAAAVSLTMGGLSWCFCTLYMSAEPMWFAADICCTLLLPVLYYLIRREGEAV